MIRVENFHITNRYLNAIVSKDCNLISVAAKVAIFAFPILILITLIFDWLNKPDIDLFNIPEHKLAKQRELILKAIIHLKEHPDRTRACSDAMAFFSEGLKKNERREWVKIPDYFHATADETNLRSILKAQTIFQNQAYKGYGAFVSTADEAGQILGYGRYTFAIDGETLKDKPGAFFIPNPEDGIWSVVRNRLLGWPSPSIWVRVESNLPVNQNSIAYIGYPPAEEQVLQGERAKIKENYPWVRWMNRKTSEKICETLRAVSTLELPRQWRWMKNETLHPLPQHIKQTA